MKSLLALVLLHFSMPLLAAPPVHSAPVGASDKGKGKGGHKDGGQKKEEEEEEDCRVAVRLESNSQTALS